MKIKIEDLIDKINYIERTIDDMCDGDYNFALHKETVIEWLEEYKDMMLNKSIDI